MTATNREKNGAPERIRTTNLLIRSQMLYPVELRAQIPNFQLFTVNQRSVCFLLFTVLFYGHPYDTVQNHENMGKNRAPKSSQASAIRQLLCPHFCWWQRDLEIT